MLLRDIKRGGIQELQGYNVNSVVDVYCGVVFKITPFIREFIEYREKDIRLHILRLKFYKTSIYYANANYFTLNVVTIFQEFPTYRNITLERIKESVVELFTCWDSYIHSKNYTAKEDTFEKEISQCINTFYLSLLIIFNKITTFLTGAQAFQIIEILSYLNWVPRKMQLLETTLLLSILPLLIKENKDYYSDIINIITIFQGNVLIIHHCLMIYYGYLVLLLRLMYFHLS